MSVAIIAAGIFFLKLWRKRKENIFPDIVIENENGFRDSFGQTKKFFYLKKNFFPK